VTRDVTAVVVAYGGSERLAATLDSIAAACAGMSSETIVVARPDDAVARAESGRARVLTPDPSVRPTPGAHRNFGARAGAGPWILFADADVVFEPGFVYAAIAALETTTTAAGAGGRIHERQWKDGRLVREIPDLHRTGRGGTVEMLAAAWLARRTAFEAVGGFDPRLPAEEDMELCIRLAGAGTPVIALDRRAAYHDCAPRPSLAEIRRRLKGGLFAGQGLVLRHAWGGPLFTRHLVRQRLFLFTVLYAALGATLLVAALAGLSWAGAAAAGWALGAAFAWALMAWRKRSLALGGLAILTWLALGLGILRAWWFGPPKGVA